MSAYRFQPIADPAHLDTADAFLVDTSVVQTADFGSNVVWALDTPVVFEVLRPLAGATDRPVLSVPLPLFSRRVAEALVAMGGFEATLYDVRLIDLQGAPVGTPDDFVLFHVRTVLPVLDREASEITDLGDGMSFVQEVAVLEPADGLPACFQVEDAEQFGILVSEAGRAAIEALSPRGFELVEVPTRREGGAVS